MANISNDKIDAIIKNSNTKSSAIRQLDKLGLTRSQIAKAMNIRYQHVRNVLITPLKTKSE